MIGRQTYSIFSLEDAAPKDLSRTWAGSNPWNPSAGHLVFFIFFSVYLEDFRALLSHTSP